MSSQPASTGNAYVCQEVVLPRVKGLELLYLCIHKSLNMEHLQDISGLGGSVS